jgi:16S rRNA (uracil1498-N3)-methyltransferase
MHIFYVLNISSSLLSEEESLHAVKVLRLQAGDAIVVVDGTGGYHQARTTQPHPKRCAFEVIESIYDYGKRNYRLHIAIAPTKNIERFEWFIEKAVEIGVDTITPMLCRYSERKIIKTERLEKIIISAAKQSIKALFPVLNTLCTFDELLKQHAAKAKFIAHCYPGEKSLLKDLLPGQDDILLLIGPEGDFSPEEVEKALQYGFRAVSLGESRLRTETAGIVACAQVAALLG